jgi:hypothetical protein
MQGHCIEIGSTKLGSLFLTLPTHGLIGQHVIFSRRVGCEHGFELADVGRLFPEPCRPRRRAEDHRLVPIEERLAGARYLIISLGL